MSITLYRFARTKYSDDLSGNGAKLYGGRWNNVGYPAIYTSFTASLSLLELLIHSVSYDEIKDNRLMIIEVPDTSIMEITPKKLKTNWEKDIDYTRFIGSEFIAHSSNLLLKVPSAIIPFEHNYVINPLHKDFSKVKLKEASIFSFDGRLFK